MEDFSKDFGPFDGKTWLNCAHQGALPKVAVAAAQEAIEWKIAPYELTTERFNEVPGKLKGALGRLIGAPAEEIILGNSASYGLHLLANGIPWRAGDEILLVHGDFPSVILPWLALERKGVRIRFMEPGEKGLHAEDLDRHISSSSRLFCTTWVHSFTGRAIDADAVVEVCRSRGLRVVVNAAQALGARPIDVSRTPVDALTSVGFKWLCGPYGTGFCWMKSELSDSLEYNQAYWLAQQTADDLGKVSTKVARAEGLGARAYDVFGTANFFNFKPWTASIDYLLQQGIERIAEHDQRLVSRLVEGLGTRDYRVLSPREGPSRSTLVIVSHRVPERNETIYQKLLKEGIYGAFRKGHLRFAPHLYNTREDIDRLLDALKDL